MKLKKSTTVIVADSEKYLVLNNQGNEVTLDLQVTDSAVRDNPPTREQVSDKPGRFPAPNAQFSSVENADWHRLAKENAATELAKQVNQIAIDDKYGRILLIADARTLGLVRPQLTSETVEKIIDEIPKDLTNHTLPEIQKIILAA